MKKRILTKDAVLLAAVKIAEEKGANALTMQELAAACDIIPSSLYNHISGLEEAQEYIVRFAAQELIAEIKEAIIGYAGNDAYLEIALAFRRFAKARPELFNAIRTAKKPPGMEVKEEDQAFAKVVHKILERYPGVDNVTRTHFLRAFSACLFGFIAGEMTGGYGGEVDADESFLVMVKHVITMLSARKEETYGKD